MGEDARSVIAEALQSLRIETRNGISVTSIDTQGITLDTGERIAAATVVWCAGMRAAPLTGRARSTWSSARRCLPQDQGDAGRIRGWRCRLAANRITPMRL